MIKAISFMKRKKMNICVLRENHLIFSAKYFDKVKNKWIRKYRGVDCENCLKQKECTRTKDGIRIVKKDNL